MGGVISPSTSNVWTRESNLFFFFSNYLVKQNKTILYGQPYSSMTSMDGLILYREPAHRNMTVNTADSDKDSLSTLKLLFLLYYLVSDWLGVWSFGAPLAVCSFHVGHLLGKWGKDDNSNLRACILKEEQISSIFIFSHVVQRPGTRNIDCSGINNKLASCKAKCWETNRV